jgi:hypothetical protein
MRIARPPSGFSIVLSSAAKVALDTARPGVPRLDDVWAGVCERLKFTAHREGDRLPNGQSILQIQGDPAFGIPKIAVVYTVVGDTVTVRRLLISV